jgi:hypothetical protein
MDSGIPFCTPATVEDPSETAAAYQWLVHQAQEVAERVKNRLRHLNRVHVFTKEEVEALEALGVDLTEEPGCGP